MADIMILTAPIGGGKSLYATGLALEELIRSDRMVVTNLPLRIAEKDCDGSEKTMTVGEWCSEYSRQKVDLSKRLRILKQEEVFEFYRYLPGGIELPLVEKIEPNAKTPDLVPDMEKRNQMARDGVIPFGAFFIIDEGHLFFNARKWQTIRAGLTHYMSQLRKSNDDLMIISQNYGKLDKNFRMDATQWVFVKNMGKTKMFGGVTLKDKFRFAIYDSEPVGADRPMTSGWTQLRKRNYHKCYDTMAGVGILGKMHPEASRVKGWHWSVWILIILGGFLAGFYVPKIILTGVGMSLRRGLEGMQKGLKPKVAPVPVQSQAAGSPVSNGNVGPVASVSVPGRVLRDVELVTMTGLMQMNGVWYVGLSDGRLLNSEDVRMQKLTEKGCLYDGHYYERAILARSVAPVQAATQPAAGSGSEMEMHRTIRWQDNGVQAVSK